MRPCLRAPLHLLQRSAQQDLRSAPERISLRGLGQALLERLNRALVLVAIVEDLGDTKSLLAGETRLGAERLESGTSLGAMGEPGGHLAERRVTGACGVEGLMNAGQQAPVAQLTRVARQVSLQEITRQAGVELPDYLGRMVDDASPAAPVAPPPADDTPTA